jgi:hypothetical protein
MPTTRARAEWAARVRAEYGSAAVTARLLHWMVQLGLERPLIDTAQRILADELDHADLSHEVLVAIGGADQPQQQELAALDSPLLPQGPLASLLRAGLYHFCLGETLAVPLFSAMREGCTHPTAREALDRILRDEAVHRAFGWSLLDSLLAIDPEGVRAWSAQALPAMLEDFRLAYASSPPSPLSPEERAVGLIAPEDYARIFEEVRRDWLGPQWARRGIATAPT